LAPFETTEHSWLLGHTLPLVIVLVSSIRHAFYALPSLRSGSTTLMNVATASNGSASSLVCFWRVYNDRSRVHDRSTPQVDNRGTVPGGLKLWSRSMCLYLVGEVEFKRRSAPECAPAVRVSCHWERRLGEAVSGPQTSLLDRRCGAPLLGRWVNIHSVHWINTRILGPRTVVGAGCWGGFRGSVTRPNKAGTSEASWRRDTGPLGAALRRYLPGKASTSGYRYKRA
jgi:hypothetical protein